MKEEYNEKYNVFEQNIEAADHLVPKTIIVHDGIAHADDIMAAWLMQQVNSDIEIYRSRNDSIIRSGLQDPYTLVADVGYGVYDHHDLDRMKYYPGDQATSQMAACGLVWKEWNEVIINEWIKQNVLILSPNEDIKTIAGQFRDYVLRPIEVKDTTAGQLSVPKEFLLPDIDGKWPLKEQESIISDFVRSNTPLLVKEQENQHTLFKKNVDSLSETMNQYIKKTHNNEFGLNPIVMAFTRQNNDLISEVDFNHKMQKKDEIVLNNYIKEELKLLDPNVEVFSLDNEFTNTEIFKDSNIKILLCPNIARTEIQVRVVNDDIQLKQNNDPSIFVHPMGHMCAISVNENRTIDDCFEVAKKISQDIIVQSRTNEYEHEYNIEQKECTVELDTDNIETAIHEDLGDIEQ